jgi:hypothetical protein
METPYTDDNRITELNQNVTDYLEWIIRKDEELKESHAETQMRLKPVNRHMVTTPVY